MAPALSPPDRGAQVIADLVREALDRVFTVELPRHARAQVIGEPRISVIESIRSGNFFVQITFEMEHRQI